MYVKLPKTQSTSFSTGLELQSCNNDFQAYIQARNVLKHVCKNAERLHKKSKSDEVCVRDT
jgi:hypothetical protein